MTTLVTGAAGFVGSHLVAALRQRGEPVRVLVRDPKKAEAFRQQGLEAVVGDLRDPATLVPAVRDVQVVQHCGAAVGHFTRDEFYATNLGGVRNLLDAIRQAGRPRVVVLSSVNVLGSRDLDPATEDTPYQPSSDPAADVKIEAEQLVLDYHQRYDMNVTILRPGFIYGPGDPHNLPKLIGALQRGKFRFIGSRENIIPIVHVDDVVQALLLAGESPRARGRIYQITDGSRTSIGEFVAALVARLGCPAPQKVLPFFLPALACNVFGALQWLKIRKQPGPVSRASLRFLGTSRYIDIRRARAELGYAPRLSLSDGLDTCIHEWLAKTTTPAAPAVHA